MSLHEEIVRVAKKYPNRTAIIDGATGKSYTYRNFLIASMLFSGIIKSKNEEFVGIMMPMSAGACISLTATLISGKVPVMINYSTGAEINMEYARTKCNFRTVISSKKLCDRLGVKNTKDIIFAEDIAQSFTVFQKFSALIKSIFPHRFISRKTADDISVLLFTTGSEKDPKTVMLTHDNITSNIESLCQLFVFDNNDIFAGVLPLFHVFGLTTSFFLPLLSGAAVNTFPNPLEYRYIAESIRINKATIITATPTFINGYCQKSEEGDFASLRIVMVGGDKLTGNLKESFMKKHGLEILEGYGTTETSPVISVNTIEKNRFGSIGQVVPGARVKIIDIDTEQPLPAGQEGKIYVKGRLVMKGYFNNMEETSLHIRNGWYDTGDIGMFDEDGFLWHKGRLKRFVKIGGEMISLTVVENAVEKYIGEEALCCATEIPHVTKGSEILVATTAEIDEAELKKKLSSVLPLIAIPKRIIHLKELPLTGNGKVDFRAVERILKNRN